MEQPHSQALEHLRHNPNLGPFERLMLEIASNQIVIINELAGNRRLLEKIMQDQAALDAQIQKVVGDFTTSLSTSVQEVKDAIAKKGGTDFTPEVTALGTLDDAINALPAQIATALAGTPAGGGDTGTGTGTGDTGTGTGDGTASAEVKRAQV